MPSAEIGKRAGPPVAVGELQFRHGHRRVAHHEILRRRGDRRSTTVISATTARESHLMTSLPSGWRRRRVTKRKSFRSRL